MSKPPSRVVDPRVNPNNWAQERDAKIQRAAELREQRRREAIARGDPLPQQPPQPQPHSAPSEADWLGPPRGAAAQGYNKAGRGGYTFGTGPSAPGGGGQHTAAAVPGSSNHPGAGGGVSVAPPSGNGGGASPGRGMMTGGDENGDVRAQLWAMKQAAQEQRRDGYPPQGGNGAGFGPPLGLSPTRQPLANFAPDYQQQQQQQQPYTQYQPPQQAPSQSGEQALPQWLRTPPPKAGSSPSAGGPSYQQPLPFQQPGNPPSQHYAYPQQGPSNSVEQQQQLQQQQQHQQYQLYQQLQLMQQQQQAMQQQPSSFESDPGGYGTSVTPHPLGGHMPMHSNGVLLSPSRQPLQASSPHRQPQQVQQQQPLPTAASAPSQGSITPTPIQVDHTYSPVHPAPSAPAPAAPAPAAPTAPPARFARILHAFAAEHKSELSVEGHECIKVVGASTSNGWVLVEKLRPGKLPSDPPRKGKKGYIPASYLGGDLPSQDAYAEAAKVAAAAAAVAGQGGLAAPKTEAPAPQQHAPAPALASGEAAAVNNVMPSASPAAAPVSLEPQQQHQAFAQRTDSTAAASHAAPVSACPGSSRPLSAAAEAGAPAAPPVAEDDFSAMLRPSIDNEKGWVSDFASGADGAGGDGTFSALDAAPRALPKVKRRSAAQVAAANAARKKKDEEAASNNSNHNNATELVVGKDGSVALRPVAAASAAPNAAATTAAAATTSPIDPAAGSAVASAAVIGRRRRAEQAAAEKVTGTVGSPNPKARSSRESSGGGAAATTTTTPDCSPPRNQPDHRDGVGGSSGGNSGTGGGSPRSLKKSKRRENGKGKPPPPPPPPDSPPPQQQDAPLKWDWEEKPIVSKVATRQATAAFLASPPGTPRVGNNSNGNGSSPRIQPPSGGSGGTLKPASTAAWLDQPYKPDAYATEEDGDANDVYGGKGDGGASGRSGRRLDEKGNPPVGATPEPEVNEYGMNAMLRELHQARAARKRVDSRGHNGQSTSSSFNEGAGDFSSSSSSGGGGMGGGDGATSPITFTTMAVKTTHLSTMAVGDFELDGDGNGALDPYPASSEPPKPLSRNHRRGDGSPRSGVRRPQWAGRPSSGGGLDNGAGAGAGGDVARPQSSGPSSPGGTLLGGPNARRRNPRDDHDEELVMDHKNPRHRRDPPLVQHRRPASGSVVGGAGAGNNGGNRSPRPSSPRLSPRLASLADPNPRKVRPRPPAAAAVAPAPGGGGNSGGAHSRDTDGGDSDSFDDLAQALRQGNAAGGGRQQQAPQKAVGSRVPSSSNGPSGGNGHVLGGPGAPPPSAHHPTEESQPSSGGRAKRGGGGGKSLGPASGAVPLNVRNARRNAGDGDDHMVDNESKGGAKGKDNSEGGKERGGTRQNFDKRTARMKNAKHFKVAIASYRDENAHVLFNQDSRSKGGNGAGAAGGGLVNCYVRKRPLFDYEAARGEYDVVSVCKGGGDKRGALLIHNCVMHPDMKRMHHKACWFPANEAFDETVQNLEVFGRCAAPLVRAVATPDDSPHGFSGIGTLFMYGQTGSGKSHTMEGIEGGVAETLSRLLHKTPHGEAEHHPLTANDIEVRLRYFELVGKRCVDLLGSKAGIELKLMNDGNDAVRPAGAAEPVVSDANHLLQLLKLGKKRRATAPTDINGGSSRSHAVCQIVVSRLGSNDGSDGSSSSGGLLTLVDCAGSERKEDSMYHDKERQRESTEINASLYALKECVRARALAAKGKNVQIPFRSSSLTKVLMESFVRPTAHLAVIATVSPIPTDTEHSISTLKTVCAIAGYPEADLVEEKADVIPWVPLREVRVPPIKWDEAQLRNWLSAVAHGRFASITSNIPKGTTGKVIMRWGPSQFSAICGGPDIGKALSKLLTEERLRCEELEKLKRADRMG